MANESTIETESDLLKRLRSEAINEIADENKNLAEENQLAFVKLVMKRFIQKKVEAFPIICEIARIQNAVKRKELEDSGKRGKYTGSVGWSEDGNFKWNWEIPQELYSFMVNMVYSDFWSDSNSRIRNAFMRRVCAGDDANNLLAWVASIYGRSGNSYMEGKLDGANLN